MCVFMFVDYYFFLEKENKQKFEFFFQTKITIMEIWKKKSKINF